MKGSSKLIVALPATVVVLLIGIVFGVLPQIAVVVAMLLIAQQLLERTAKHMMSDGFKAGSKAERPRDRITVITPPENVGEMGFGPVVVLHISHDAPLQQGDNFANAFGPYMTIGEALADIDEKGKESGDVCYKVILPIHLGGALLKLENPDQIEEVMRVAGFKREPEPTTQGNKGLVN